MIITSPDFKNSAYLPAKFTFDGANVNPELNIYEIPHNTKSIALIMDDPDATYGTFVHWVVYNIPPNLLSIKQDSLPGVPGINSYRKNNYNGPCPPAGTHRYFFRVYALDMVLSLPKSSDKHAVHVAMEGHILDKAELIGLYKSR